MNCVDRFCKMREKDGKKYIPRVFETPCGIITLLLHFLFNFALRTIYAILDNSITQRSYL